MKRASAPGIESVLDKGTVFWLFYRENIYGTDGETKFQSLKVSKFLATSPVHAL